MPVTCVYFSEAEPVSDVDNDTFPVCGGRSETGAQSGYMDALCPLRGSKFERDGHTGNKMSNKSPIC